MVVRKVLCKVNMIKLCEHFFSVELMLVNCTASKMFVARLGSLSYRFNVGPMMSSDVAAEAEALDKEPTEANVTEEKKEKDEEGAELNNVKRELKKYKEENKKVREEYFKCATELRKKTEENTILRTEVNDLKQQVRLEKEEDTDFLVDEEVKKNDFEEEGTLFKQKNSGFRKKNPQCEPTKQAKTNVNNMFNRFKSREKEYNCCECDYQGSKEMELTKHVNLKHSVVGNVANNVDVDGMIKCRNCGDLFTTKWNLMNHRKSEHWNTVAFCRNYLQGKCDFADNICWWSHAEKVQSSDDQVHCFVCNKIFKTKPSMMSHRKKEHPDIIRRCLQFQNNECRFQNESCWFKHEQENESVPETVNREDNMETESGFWKVPNNPNPPLQSNQKPGEKGGEI